MKILIGYDGSKYSDVIFEDLKLAGLPRDAEVQVVSVADILMSSPPAKEVAAQILTSRRVAAALKRAETHTGRVIKEAEEFASSAGERLQTHFPEWNVETRVITGTPAWELMDAANDWDADLVVVGSRGRSAISSIFLGSVSKHLATDAQRSVRVVKNVERKKENAPPRIIIGVDGSPAAEAAIFEVGRRVWEAGTQVRLVAVHDQSSPASLASILPKAAELITDHNQSQARRADSMIQRASNQLKTIGLNVSISIQRGDPKRILLQEARRWNADSVFVGTREFKNSFERFRLGSVSTAVVTKAPCSVEIVRPPQDNQQI